MIKNNTVCLYFNVPPLAEHRYKAARRSLLLENNIEIQSTFERAK